MKGGLNFSDFGSGWTNQSKKNSFRKAGEAFSGTGGNTSNNSSGKSSNYDKWVNYMGSQSFEQKEEEVAQPQKPVKAGWTPKEETKSEKSLAEIKSEKVRRNRQGEIVPLDEWNATWNPKGYYIKEDGSLHHPG